MKYALDRFADEVRAAIASTGQIDAQHIDLATPKPNIPADLAFPAFKAAKERKVAPPQLANELAATAKLPTDSLIGSVASAGPFLNFALNPERLAEAVLTEVAELGAGYGNDDQGAGRSLVIDYSSPNVAKLMHVGHIRSTIIGQSLRNIMHALGYHTVSDNHLGDWGKQFGMNIAAIMKWGRPQGEDEEALAQLDKLYAQYAGMVRAEKEQGITTLDDEARAWSLKLEQGDQQARDLWQWMVDLTLKANQINYDRLGVHFDHNHGESFYESMLGQVIDDALQSKVAYRDEGGAVVVDLGSELPTFLLQRSDGGTLYHTRDVATIMFRMREFNPAQILYVVGIPQELHFRQLFALVRAMGYVPDTTELAHIKFGTVFDQSGNPLSTRRGNMIYLSDLLDDAHRRARAVVDQTSANLPEAEREAIAEAVGVGAVIYNDLFQDPKRNITIDWDKMLALEGNSAPYIQYMYARCRSILRQAGTDATSGNGDVTLLMQPAEQALIKQIAKLPGAIREAGARYAPFVVAEWCYETARAFSTFYRDCPVLKAEPAVRAARLQLVAATAQSLRNGLSLLGVNVPERM